MVSAMLLENNDKKRVMEKKLPGGAATLDWVI